MSAAKSDNLLLLEDDRNLGSTLSERLTAEGHGVFWVQSVADAERRLQQAGFRLALLDVNLPDGSGFDLAQVIRRTSPQTALIFLTAKSDPEDRIKGLELGAEDYISKPFHFKELLLRIRNVIKRTDFLFQEERGDSSASVLVGRAKVYFSKFQAEVDGELRALTHKEVSVLKLLVDHRGDVVSRDRILDRAWSEDEFPTPRTVDNFIVRLRRLVEFDGEGGSIIKSVRGVGYQLV